MQGSVRLKTAQTGRQVPDTTGMKGDRNVLLQNMFERHLHWTCKNRFDRNLRDNNSTYLLTSFLLFSAQATSKASCHHNSFHDDFHSDECNLIITWSCVHTHTQLNEFKYHRGKHFHKHLWAMQAELTVI